nr:protein hid1 [Quercus suber]
MVTSNGSLESMYAPMLFVIYDIAPYVQNLQRATSIRLFNLFAALANTEYLYHRRDNPQNLVLLLDAFSRILQFNAQENPRFVETLLHNRKQIYALRDFSVDGAHAELDRQAQRRKDQSNNDSRSLSRTASIDSVRSPIATQSPSRHMPEQDVFAIGNDEDDDTAADAGRESETTPRALEASTSATGEATASPRNISEKARGKQPAHRSQRSRQTSLSCTTSTNNSTASLSALVTTSQGNGPHQFIPTQAWLETWIPYLPLHTILEVCDVYQSQIRRSEFDVDSKFIASPALLSATILSGSPVQAADQHSCIENQDPRSPVLVRTPLSMSWYLSLIWGLIFAADATVNKGIRGVWTGTAIKLFNIESREQAITLRSPKGAVDALGNSIAQRLGHLSLTPRDSQQQPVTMREV